MHDGAFTAKRSELDTPLGESGRDVSVLMTDPWLPDNPVVFVSPAFTALTGYEAADVVGRSWGFLQGPDTDPETIRRLREAVRREEPVTLEILSYRRDGTAFWSLLQVRPCHASSGRLTHFLAVQRDIPNRTQN